MTALAFRTWAREGPGRDPADDIQGADERAGVLEDPVGGPVEVLLSAVPVVETLVVAAQVARATEGPVGALAEVPVGGAFVHEGQAGVGAQAAAQGA